MSFNCFVFGVSLIVLCASSCSNDSTRTSNKSEIEREIEGEIENEIVCSTENCSGFYSGPEFVDGSDVAHQFSNEMSEVVGDKLKELYRDRLYSKVDLSKIEMSTMGMGSGKVVYKLVIPFIRVDDKCEAFTSFDHVGGWNHAPALEGRKRQLQKALMKGEKLDVSELNTTPEGLQEYWIQWKNKIIQLECAPVFVNGPP